MNINHVLVITKREWKSYFHSPIAYIVAIIFLVVSGVFFWPVFFVQNQADLRSFLNMLPWVLTFIVPAITMKTFAEEKNTGSYELLVTLPLKLEEVIIGKFMGAALLVWSIMLFVFIYGVSVELVGDLDWGPVWGGFLGSVFLASTYLSIGIFSSSLTNNQIIAFLVALSINLFLFLVDKFLIFLPDSVIDFFSFFSSEKHFRNFAKGIMDSRDVFYYAFFGFVFLLATYQVLNRQFNQKK